jgi:hypothetical protein
MATKAASADFAPMHRCKDRSHNSIYTYVPVLAPVCTKGQKKISAHHLLARKGTHGLVTCFSLFLLHRRSNQLLAPAK